MALTIRPLDDVIRERNSGIVVGNDVTESFVSGRERGTSSVCLIENVLLNTRVSTRYSYNLTWGVNLEGRDAVGK